MRVCASYGRHRGRYRACVRPLCCLILLPLIVAAFTVTFLGYSVWRLAYLLWQFTCRTGHLIPAGDIARTLRQVSMYA